MRPPFIAMMAPSLIKVGQQLLRDYGEIEHIKNSSRKLEGFIEKGMSRILKTLTYEIQKQHPNHGMWSSFSPEPLCLNQERPFWLMEILSGQDNFQKGIPMFSVALTLQERDRPFCTMIYEPLRNEMFWAQRGMGAFLNQSRLRVDGASNFIGHLALSFSIPAQEKKFWDAVFSESFGMAGVRQDAALLKKARIFMSGDPLMDMAFVAAGRYDGFYIQRPLSMAQKMAGFLLIKEAGGLCCETAPSEEVFFGGKPELFRSLKVLKEKSL